MIWLWLGFFAIVLALLGLDLGVFHRRPHALGLREATAWTLFWIAVSLAFNGGLYFIYEHHWLGAMVPSATTGSGTGVEAAVSFFTGYLLEKALSVDNIFVMAMLFDRFRVEAAFQHRVLFWGILGAIVSRSLMIGAGVWLVTRFDWLFYLFGAYLAYAGVKLLLFRGGDDGDFDPDRNLLLRLIGRVVPISRGDHRGRFIVRHERRLHITRLMLALIVIEITDVLFAFDSVPAVLAITTDTFIVLTSNIFAILGLRALYFVLRGMLDKFQYLQIALAVVLVFIGSKMLLHQAYKLPTAISLLIIAGTLALGIAASLIRSHSDRPR